DQYQSQGVLDESILPTDSSNTDRYDGLDALHGAGSDGWNRSGSRKRPGPAQPRQSTRLLEPWRRRQAVRISGPVGLDGERARQRDDSGRGQPDRRQDRYPADWRERYLGLGCRDRHHWCHHLAGVVQEIIARTVLQYRKARSIAGFLL